MNASQLIQTDGLGCPFPFFGELEKPAEKIYKIYNDGGHFIATRVTRQFTRKPREISTRPQKDYTPEQQDTVLRGILRDKRKALDEHGRKRYKNAVDRIDLSPHNGTRYPRSAMDILFDNLYFEAYKQGLKDKKGDKPMTEFIRTGILKLFPASDDLDKYIADKLKRKYNNLVHRKKRFRRKANLNRWNYFVTATYFYGHYKSRERIY